MKPKCLYLIVGFVAALLLVLARAQAQTPLDALYKAAKAEGELVLWSPVEPRHVRVLAEAFNKEFPRIKVNHFEIRESDYVSRVATEARQGIVNLDMATARIGALAPFFERDLIQPYDDWLKLFRSLNPAAVSRDGRLLTFYSLVYPLAYNTQMVKPEEVPTSWGDLLAAKWQRMIILEPRALAFAYLGLKWGREEMVDYIKKLKANRPFFVKGGTVVAQQLVAGAAPLAVGAYVNQVLEMRKDGAPIDWAKKVSPIGSGTTTVYVMKRAKHSNAAKLFAGWLASDKAQSLIYTQAYYGTLYPGSSYVVMREMERNGVEVAADTIDNYEELSALSDAAVKALDVLR